MPPIIPRNSRFRIVAATLFGCCLLLGGCASGVKPQSQTIRLDQLDAGENIAAAARVAWPQEDWWRAYGDRQLDALVAQGVAGSPTLRAAQARVRLAKAQAAGAQAGTEPNASLGASATDERFTEQQFIPPPWAGHFNWYNEIMATLSWDLDLWGKKASGWQAALDEASAAAAETQQVRLELETAIVRSYIRLAEAYALRDIAEAALAQARQRVAIVRRALTAGLGTEREARAAETALPVALARIEALETAIAIQRNQLAALTGAAPGAGDKITRPALRLDAPIGLPAALPAALIGQRPDVRASRWRVEAAGQRVAAAKAAFYPNLNLLAFAGFQAFGFRELLRNSALAAGAGPAFSLPLFDGGKRQSGVEAATAADDSAIESYNETVIHALQQVADQLLLLQSGAAQSEKAKEAVRAAEEAHRLAEAGYRAGLENYQQVLEAQAALLQQQEFAARAQAEWQDAHAGLMRALGGGVKPAPGPATEAPP